MKIRAYWGNIGWAFLLVVFLLAACSTTPAVKYYTLNSLNEMQQDAPEPVSGSNLAIGVGPVGFPKLLDRPQIVTRQSQNRVRVSEFHNWASPLQGDFSRVLAKNISILLPTDRVAVHPWTDQFSPTYRIRLNVGQFDGQLGEHVILNVTWSVATQEGTNEVVVKNTAIKEPVSAKDYEALVAAKSRALAALSRAIVDEIKRLSE
ncbi:MAG: membrane integrity-associated transporter subunit PqiC [Deltaproteobacteria bacterium]|nr:membrane integrity-associated transporter subunit PqiC [Deltaproteobacteria bacterium]